MQPLPRKTGLCQCCVDDVVPFEDLGDLDFLACLEWLNVGPVHSLLFGPKCIIRTRFVKFYNFRRTLYPCDDCFKSEDVTVINTLVYVMDYVRLAR